MNRTINIRRLVFKLPKLIDSLCLVFLCTSTLSAQQDSTRLLQYQKDTIERVFFEIIPQGEIGLPIGNYKNELGMDAIAGKGITILYYFKNQPLNIGFRYAHFTHDIVRREFTDPFDGADLVQLTKSKIRLFYGVLQYEPNTKLPARIRPYLGASIGIQRLLTKTFSRERNAFFNSNDDEDESLNNRFDKDRLHSDWGWSFTGTGGLKIVLDKDSNVALDLQAGYRVGELSDFYVRTDSDVIEEEPFLNYELRDAFLSMISIKVGISVFIYGD